MTRPGPTLVILAGGASRRLGTCKALVQLGPRTALQHLLAASTAFDSAPPIVVAGRHFEALAAAVREEPRGVRLVHNPTWELGRTGSLQAACAAEPDRDFCLAPVDVPLVPASVFEALARAWERAGSPARGWLAPRTSSPSPAGADRADRDGPPPRFGHPVVLGRDLLAAVACGAPDQDLRGFRSLGEPLWSIPVAGNEILDDLDGPDDLRRLRSRLESATPRTVLPPNEPPP